MTAIATVDRNLICQTGIVPSNMRLIQDVWPLKVIETKDTLTEAVAGQPQQKLLKITGIFQKADEKNQNGRIYPREVLANAVANIKEDIAIRAVKGEWDHPTDAKVHLERVSHLITKVWMEGKYVYGEAEVLDDPAIPFGAMMAAMLRRKVQLGISSRGIGDMETVTEGADEYQKVLPGYTIVTWDIVGEPSIKEAVLAVMEGRNRILTRSAKAKLDPNKALLKAIDEWLGRK